MNKLLMLLLTIFALVVPGAFAQNHGEVGVFADYFRLHPVGDVNFWGVGGRLSVNTNKFLQLEGEVSYDFERNITNTFTSGVTTTFTRSPLRLVHGLFGPKLQTGGGAIRAFVTAKGGFLNFSVSNASIPAGFTSAIGNITTGDTNGVFYPGGGVEFYAGPVGLRLDVGDFIYFDDGANHNLRISFGPHIRF